MTRNQNHDDDASSSSSSSSSRKRFKTFDNDGVGVAPWSDVDHDVLFLVMMQLGVVEFLAFSGVCKSWRSLALSNKNMFMASRPPMKICTDDDSDSEDSANRKGWWYLEDYEKRRFKTIIPHSANRICFGITCGYLIFFGEETHDFWLVNPITRHELHFPHLPLSKGVGDVSISAVLVFSPSISGWVFVVLYWMNFRYRQRKRKMSFYIAGKQGWNHVSFTLPIFGLQYFKGKIYTRHNCCTLGELRLYPNRKHKWMLLEPKNHPEPDLVCRELVSSGENLYVLSRFARTNKVLELDIGEMKWVSPQKTIEKYAFFLSHQMPSAAVKPRSWVGNQTQYNNFNYVLDTGETRQGMFLYEWMWYFPHDCLNVNLLDE